MPLTGDVKFAVEHSALRSLVGIGLVDREVDVAVAGVTAPGHERAVLPREFTEALHVVGDRRAGHDDVDDVIGTGSLRDPERFLPGFDQPLT